MPKVLFYGGSFDPPHRVHRRLLEAALQLVQPDVALVVPTGNASSYKKRELSPAADRLRMCQLAFGDLPRVQISSIEAHSPQPNYTIDSLGALECSLGQGVQWFLLLGADQLAAIRTWRRWSELLAKVTIVLADRPGLDPATHRGKADGVQNGHNSSPCNLLHLPLLPDGLSSTAIRLALTAQGQGAQVQAVLQDALDARVLRYIADHSLYF